MSVFFKRLSYSFGNEDWNTEHRALKIKQGDRMLCVTASGDRPLHLLLDDCKEVIAIDVNPIQNHLLSLKIAAMQYLDFDSYLSFLGGTAGKNRSSCLKSLTPHMDKQSGQYWQQHEKPVVKGILYQGAMEQWVSKLSRMARLIRGSKIKQLFEIPTLEDQQNFVRRHWDQYLWRKIFDLAHPLFSRYFLKDPGMYDNIGTAIRPSAYIYQRMNACLMRHLARENPLLSLLFKGHIDQEAFPPYLTERGFTTIKTRLGRVSSQTADLVSYLEAAPDNHFDGFSLSDVASYICKDTFTRLMHAVQRTAKPGARFSIREFLSSHKIPEILNPTFKRDYHLERQLEQEDRCFVYRFMVGKIEK